MNVNEMIVSATLEAVRVAHQALPAMNSKEQAMAHVVNHLRGKYGDLLPLSLDSVAEQAIAYAVIIATGADE